MRIGVSIGEEQRNELWNVSNEMLGRMTRDLRDGIGEMIQAGEIVIEAR